MYFYIYIIKKRVKLSGVKGDIIDSIDSLGLNTVNTVNTIMGLLLIISFNEFYASFLIFAMRGPFNHPNLDHFF